MSTSDNPVFSEEATHAEKAEANRIAASLEAKPKMSRAESKRRKAIKSQPPLANPAAPLAESITAPQSAKAADEEAARLLYVASVQKAAECISAEFAAYNVLSTRVEEVRADYERLKTAKVTFKSKFTNDRVFVENCRLVRVFFATRRAHESLVGADKVTRYTTAIDYFDGECNVSYEYVRRLAAEVSEVGKLLLIDAPPKPPKKKKAAEAGYEEVEKYGKVAETIAGVTVNPTVEAAFEALEAATPLFNALTEEVPALRSVDAIYDAIVAFSLEAARSLPTYDKLELSSRLSEHFASDLTIQDSHSHTITVTPVEVEA